MGLRVVCSGYLVRYPLGGFSWHHLQYLVGFQRLGNEVTYFEHYGWPHSCYDPSGDIMSADPAYGIAYVRNMLSRYGLDDHWCYLAEDGTAYGMTREHLRRRLRECDVYFNLSNINWIPELEECRCRVLVDTDPVFTQIGAHGLGGPFSGYHALLTYGENVHRDGCTMPTGGARWLPTRQPVVLDLWTVEAGNPAAPFTTVTNWSPLADQEYEGRVFGQKDREFEPFFSFPREAGEPMEISANPPAGVRQRLSDGGWRVANPLEVTRDPWSYQEYVRTSRAEFCVAKHGYVSTRCGWFSDRSSAYLASGRPVVVQDTGFSDWLPTGSGVIAFKSRDEALGGLEETNNRYEFHCRAARAIAAEYFDSRKVLSQLIERAMSALPVPARIATTESIPFFQPRDASHPGASVSRDGEEDAAGMLDDPLSSDSQKRPW